MRALTGLVFVGTIIGAILGGAYSFLALFCIITGLTIWELYGLFFPKEKGITKRVMNVTGGVYLFAATFLYKCGIASNDIFLPYILFLLILFIMELYYKAANPISNWANLLLVQVYCAVSFAVLNLIAFDEGSYSAIFVLSIFAFIWINDTAAYLAGITFGKHRLFERISPKKSWEGFWGGLIAVLSVAYLASYHLTNIEWYHWLGIAATVVVFATWGDLTESLLKRTLDIKDSGKILPGHGGMLDRFDSMLMAVPAVYIYIELFIRN